MSLDPEVRRGGNLPFGMNASLWMCDPRYSTNARTLYGILVTYADAQKRNTAMGKPYRLELAAQLGTSVTTVDRTLVEMEVAGMVTIEARVDPSNPKNNDANIYHLHDAGVMWKGNVSWVDPLPPGVKAPDVAKQVIERRRKEKKAKGITAKGGVPKGVSPKARKAAREAAEAAAEAALEQQEETPPGPQEASGEDHGGSSTGAARGSSTDAAGVAAPTLLNVYSPFHTPDPDAKSPRSGGDGPKAPAGSSVRASASGSAASSKDQPPATQAESKGAGRKTRPPLTAVQRSAVDTLAACLPQELNGTNMTAFSNAVVTALADGRPESRTADQLAARIQYRWYAHNYAGKEIKNATGAAIALVRAYKASDRYGCANPRCEDGVDVDSGAECNVCPERLADRKAQRGHDRAEEVADSPVRPAAPSQASAVPEQRPAATRVQMCLGCDRGFRAPEPGLCRDCREDEANRPQQPATAPF